MRHRGKKRFAEAPDRDILRSGHRPRFVPDDGDEGGTIMADQAWPWARRLGLWLASATLTLTALHGVVTICWFTHGCGALGPVVNQYGYLFSLTAEQNLPTWFATILLYSAALGFAVVAATRPAGTAGRGYWIGLVVLCLYLSLDEATDLHGLWPKIDVGHGYAGWRAGFAWVAFGGLLVLAVGAVYLRWVLALPARVRWLFLAAGATYVTGGLGFEVLGSLVADETFFTPAYLMISTAEETLEMLGVVILLVGIATVVEGERPAVHAWTGEGPQGISRA